MKTYEIEYQDGDAFLRAFVAEPTELTSKTPVVLISHMWAGREKFVEEKARYFAEKGYIGFALDMYGHAKVGNSVEENMALMTPFVEDRALMQKRIQAGFNAILDVAKADIDKVVAIGYCFGGLCVQDLARVNKQVKGVISVHGLMKQADNIQQGQFDAKVLLLHGADDPMVSDEDWFALRSELNQAHCDWQKHDFGGVMHAFTNPNANDKEMGTVYDETANARSDALIDNFLKECFQ